MKHDSLEECSDIRWASPGGVLLLLPPLLVAALILVAAFSWTSQASAEIKADDGEASINGGEVYAGNGCARAGDAVAGDCGGAQEEGGDEETTSEPEMTMQGGDALEETAALEGTSRQEEDTTTGNPDIGGGGTVPEDTVSDDAACPTEPTTETREATVERVVDGDTLEISEEIEGTDRVRLIGVDSPEMDTTEEGAEDDDDKDEDPEPGAVEASEFTADALEGEDVTLEPREEAKDDYDRLLAYVWIPAETGAEGEAGQEEEEGGLWSTLKRMVGVGGDEGWAELFNQTLLREGHAETLAIEPNDAYAKCFEAAEQRAAADEQYGASDGQYPADGQYRERPAPGGNPSQTPERTATEEPPAPGETASEKTTTDEDDAPEQTASEQTASEQTASEMTMPDEKDEERSDTPEETADEPGIREQYDEPEAPGETTPSEETTTQARAPETAMPEQTMAEETPEKSMAEETTAEMTEETTEGTIPEPEATPNNEPAPPASLTVEPPETERPRSSSGEPVEEQVTESEAPVAEPVSDPVSEPVAAGPITEPVEETYEPPEDIAEGAALDTLPIRHTPEGSVAVLPDTGGLSGPSVLAGVSGALGALCLITGGGSLLLAAAIRRRGREPESR